MKVLFLLVAFASGPSAFAMGGASGYSKYLEKSVPADVRAQFVQDMTVLGTFSGKKVSPLHEKYFGPLSGGTYLAFIFRRVSQIAYDPNETFATARSRGDRITLAPTYPQLPQALRMSLLIHESAHSHGGPWHSLCPKPYLDEQGNPAKSGASGVLLEGLGACDYDLQGAYGMQAVFLGNIARNCDSCSEKIRQDAELYLPNTFLRFPDLELRRVLMEDCGVGLLLAP
ncbi:hypothetical protein WDW86_21265 [Bdellovibrionota bacterium FG-2]